MRSDKYNNTGKREPKKEIKKVRKKDTVSEDFLAEFRNIEENKNRPVKNGVSANYNEGYGGYNKESNKKQDRKEKSAKVKKTKKNGKKKRIWPKVLIVLLLLIGVSVAGAYYFIDKQLSKFDYVETDYKEFGIDEDVAKKLEGYRNIAVLGTDERQGESAENARTDAIIIATIEESTGKITLTSIMRDTYLLMDDKKGNSFLDKATHAHAFGGPVNTCKMLNKSLDLNISEFIVMDWVSVADAVDGMDGITVDVHENELADLNKWGPETAENTGRTWKKVTSAGEQKLDGAQAATYCRIRKTSGGDPGRTSRIKKVLEAMLSEAKSHPTKIPALTDKVLPEIRTNMNTSAFTSLIPKVMDFNISKSVGYPFNYWGGIMSGKWIAIPTTLEENNAKFHKEVFGDENYTMSNQASKINQKIIKETGITQGTDSE